MSDDDSYVYSDAGDSCYDSDSDGVPLKGTAVQR